MKNKFREFPISSWAIDNRTTIFLLTILITVAGLVAFRSLPKENFPEIAWPVIYVSTPYPGTSPQDIENLVTRKIEKELKGLEGLKEINSTSIQDFSSIFVEFETDVNLEEAKLDVQDAVDRAKSELPNDLPADPMVIDINLSEIPIMFINVSGNYDNVTLKRYAEDIKEELEKMREILRVDIVGAPEREIQVNVDLYKMQAANVSFSDIENAIAGENVIISGGEIKLKNQKVAVRVNGEFHSVQDIQNIVVRSGRGNIVYLKDIAEVVDGFKEAASFARLNGESVITLNVIKKAGENLVDASDNIRLILDEMKAKRFPEDLTVLISGDQSVMTRNTLNELTNTIIIGFILVTIVLMFFMGIRDALFVGLAVPLSSFIAFAILPALGFTMNLIVLFSFILAMGIVVDNAIVVIENTYRIFHEGELPLKLAAKKAAGEVIGPVFAGTLTTVCPFLPLLFWGGPVGEFMGFMPVVMIITLFASLFVAYVINPVFAVSFMKRNTETPVVKHRQVLIYTGAAAALSIFFHLISIPALGNIMLFMAVFVPLYHYVLKWAIHWFQQRMLPAVKGSYRSLLAWSLEGRRPYGVIAGAVLFLFLVGALVGASDIKYVMFPETQPNFIYVYNELPTGTRIEVTDSVTRIIEARVNEVLGPDNPDVKAVITNVAIGAGDVKSFDQNSSKPNKGKVTVEFVSFRHRKGPRSTRQIMNEVRDNMPDIPGAKITVGYDEQSPPGSSPVEVKLTAEDFGQLMQVGEGLYSYLDSVDIPGVENLKWDVDEKRPELLINIDREKARELGMSSGQIGMALRTALFGKEVSKLRSNEDDYEIVLRLDERYRNDIASLLDMRVTYMDQSIGRFKSVPISSVAGFEYTTAYGGVNRSDLNKSITISSNILTGYNVNDVNAEVEYWVEEFKKKAVYTPAVDIEVGGETKDQAEEGQFLAGAFAAAILLIFMILVTQFNSFSSVLIIMSQVLLSIMGVFIGHLVTGMDFSVVLSGVGLVVLAGIVVNNGIILLDFFQILQRQGMPLKEAIIEGGAIRFTPVLLTASSTVLGLVPLALSFNINFGTLLTRLDPQIFFGGDSAVFWEPFSWSVIYGLSFATIITLVIVPVIYYVVKRGEARLMRALGLGRLLDDEPHNSTNGQGREEDLIDLVGEKG